MGFFDLNATCAYCGKKLGLNRSHVKQSDAWMCMKCVWIACGNPKYQSNSYKKITIEELCEIIAEQEKLNAGKKQEKQRISAEKKREKEFSKKQVPPDFERASKLYYDTKRNGYGSASSEVRGVLSFKVIVNNLLKDEKVLATFMGYHSYLDSTRDNGCFAFAITDKRILLGQSRFLSGITFQAIYIENLRNITLNTGYSYGKLIFDTTKETFCVNLSRKTVALHCSTSRISVLIK